MKSKIIVLSGSARFLDEFAKQYVRIACEGNIPFTIAGNCKDWPNYEGIKPLLDAMYLKVIDTIADELFVINVGGYIGESADNEIWHARVRGISINYLEPKEVQRGISESQRHSGRVEGTPRAGV